MQQQEANLFEYSDKKLMWEIYVNKIITNTDLRFGTYDQVLIPGWLTDLSCPLTKVIFLINPTAELLPPSFHHREEKDLTS